ncbi:predicted protein [Sclerotinia sclerotiorum 1980 UF-70]|uniref:Uncharacterized protein n=1 Tax=Sclerotinia sclerotiorum (strain ATCC 18683 / 1980 / Ss-1) TaxID=665079 RepID=A7ETN7_SCLS1|nr:predicted protein [Sclerotinia sclerotiorum 1980 UF-70]EDN92829.1 predicted protein [Sclerotinia sclerotiorum 1980 UF-70]
MAMTCMKNQQPGRLDQSTNNVHVILVAHGGSKILIESQHRQR